MAFSVPAVAPSSLIKILKAVSPAVEFETTIVETIASVFEGTV